MTNSTCPYCGEEVLLTAVESPRNGKWTVLPLQDAFSLLTKADFTVLDETHEAVNIMDEVVGEFPVAVYKGEMSRFNTYRTHHPSHYLGDPHDQNPG